VQVRQASDNAEAAEQLAAAAGDLGTGDAICNGTLRAQIEDLQSRVADLKTP